MLMEYAMIYGDRVTDRRRYARIGQDCQVQLKQIPQNFPGQIHNTLSKDISEGGLQLSSFYFYPVNTKIMLELYIQDNREPVKTVGKVVWVEQFPYQERYRVGIEFSELDDEGRGYLRQVIASNAN